MTSQIPSQQEALQQIANHVLQGPEHKTIDTLLDRFRDHQGRQYDPQVWDNVATLWGRLAKKDGTETVAHPERLKAAFVAKKLGLIAADTTSLLLDAADLGDADLVCELITDGADASAKDAIGDTVLHLAIRSRSVDAVRAVLQARPDLEVIGGFGNTPLMFASTCGSAGIVEALLGAGADISATDRRQQTVLHLSTNADVTRLLVRAGMNLAAQDRGGQTPLHNACTTSMETSLGSAMGRMSDLSRGVTSGSAPAGTAALQIHLANIEAMLDLGADIEAVDKDGNTPLMEACRFANTTMASRLLDRGANPHATNRRGETALHLAAANEHDTSHLFETLTIYGAEVSRPDADGNTPLHEGVSTGHVANVRMLLGMGASVNARNASRETPLHVAASGGGAYGLARLLGAAPPPDDGVVAQALIDAGAAINAQDEQGDTPLHRAYQRHREATKDTLLAAGADTHILNNNQCPPHLLTRPNPLVPFVAKTAIVLALALAIYYRDPLQRAVKAGWSKVQATWAPKPAVSV